MMDGTDGKVASLEGPDPCRREGLLVNPALSMDLVSAFAGDRLLTERERFFFDDLIAARGDDFFPDLLYSITHEHFPPDVAKGLWTEILRHKFEMSKALTRNVRVAVAALDFLSNLKGELRSPTLIGEARVADITRLALRDGLTRLFNHATCIEKIDVELRICRRYGRPASLIMVDVDDFKRINDSYGHHTGDRVLAALGALIETAVRDSDICCRYGGEEFAVILPETGAEEAGKLAERLRGIVESASLEGLHVTLSVGVATCDSATRTAEELVGRADAALYQAKKAGKNRVVEDIRREPFSASSQVLNAAIAI